MERSPRKALAALPLVALAALAVLAITIRSESVPGQLEAATPVPDAALKQECIEGAAVGSGNDGLAGDCALLLAARDTLRGAERLNWSAETAIASWEGITVGGSPSRVTRLVLDRNTSGPLYGRRITLRGTIPAELGGLAKLDRLTLARHELTGTIPVELANLSELTDLQLHGNELTGGIPPELGALASLSHLSLSRNRLSGAIPVELGKLSSLGTLELHNNQLTGAVPASLGDLSNLYRLNLAGNAGLTGCIPESLRSVRVNDLGSLSLSYCTTTTTHSLTTSVTGGGHTSPLPGTYSYLDGASVTVTATPDARWSLISWGDDCRTAGTAATCTLTLDADRTASVTFARVPRTLMVTAGEGGTVTHDGAETIYDRDEVTLTASWNDATHSFGGWGGDCAGETSTCVLTMDANKTVTATFTALSATRCSMTNDANCIRAVYIGAPGDYAQVVDIPSAMLLSAGPGGTYRVDADLEVTVVTAARLPGGWNRFYLNQSPARDPAIATRQLIPPVGTTYTFTASHDPLPSTISFDLHAARARPLSRPGSKPDIGATVVETEFQVVSCTSGIAMTSPDTNTELVADCDALLLLRETLRGTGKLNWTAGKPMSDWMGVTVSGSPQRVTALNLSGFGLDGQLSGLLGNLTGLTDLRLNGNALTGTLPSNLAQLTSLTNVSLSGTSFTGCTPSALRQVATNDVAGIGLDNCGEITDLVTLLAPAPDTPIPPGTYTYQSLFDVPPITFDVPAGLSVKLTAETSSQFASSPPPPPPGSSAESRRGGSGIGVLFEDPEGRFEFWIDLQVAGASNRVFLGTMSDAEREAINELIDRMVESTWFRPQ